MANPQTEDGHIEIANDLWEAIVRQRLSGSEFQVLLAVLRKTYGFKKKSDWISNRQLALMTGLHPIQISQNLSRLKERGIIRVNEIIKGYQRIVSINKDYDTWKGLTKSLRVNEIIKKGLTKSLRGGKRNRLPYIIKEKHTKEKHTKRKGAREGKMKAEEQRIFDEWNAHPKIKPKHRAFTTAMRKGVSARLKTYSVDEICAAIRNYGDSTDGFWVDWRERKRGWTLDVFLSRGEGAKVEQFLPGPIVSGSTRHTGKVGGGRRFLSRGTDRG